jgi:hypothetical protein
VGQETRKEYKMLVEETHEIMNVGGQGYCEVYKLLLFCEYSALFL